MAELKLPRLPNRTPVRITVTLSSELDQALRQYAGIYRVTYGQAESVAELIPFMLGAFLDSDRAFAKARREGLPNVPPEPAARRRGRQATSPSIPITSTEE